MSTKKSSKKTSTQNTQNTQAQAQAQAQVSPSEVARGEITTFLGTVADTCEAILGAMKDGEHVSMDSVTTACGTALNVKPERVYPIVSLYLNRRPGVTIAKGRAGGVYLGAPPPKAVDPEQAARLLKKAEKAEAAAKAAAEKATTLRARAGGAPVQATEAAAS